MPCLTLAQHEREDFASFLESLTPEQWESPTLCDRWNVRQVAAHAISFDELGAGELVRRFMRGRGPEVAGEGEALLIAMAGRRDAVKDVRGPGTDKLATRM